MAKRKYIVTFCLGTEYQKKYVRMCGINGDDVYSKACKKYGNINVSRVYSENKWNFEFLKTKGFVELI